MSADGRKKRVCNHIDLSWNKGRLALSEQMQSKYFSYKGSFISRPLNSAGFAELVRTVRSAMPDLEVVVDECVCEGHKVVTSSTAMGTLATPLLGYPASDKILAIAAMSVWTLNPAGDIEEVTTLVDLEGMRLQLGIDTPLAALLPST
ncbi:ester cyclase [Pseudomonas lopnurensis]|uniref:ester cyclase n=1 Tax=Pseudomonas lopnurensis TaxID=1477517 RepID=UPI00187AE537|nr:ester cyclase [Pseudomonas lopnurensis]MBE7375986.1 ester cyclase [Pseudomonas lopnurensis]